MVHSPLRPWSSRSSHVFTLPKPRRVPGPRAWVQGSSVLRIWKNSSFFLDLLFWWRAWIISTLPTAPILPMPVFKSVVAWRYCFHDDENALDTFVLLLASQDAWCWPRYLLHLLLFTSGSMCFSNVHVLLQWDVVPFWSARSTVPFFLLFFSDTPSGWRLPRCRSSSRYRSKMIGFFLGTLEVITRFAIQLGAFAATKCFLSGSPSSRNNCACREYFENNSWRFWQIVPWLRHLLLDLLAPHLQYVSPRVSQWLHVWHFTASAIMNISWASVLRCSLNNRRFLEVLMQSFFGNTSSPSFDFCCLETRELVPPTTLSMRYFPGPRCQGECSDSP